MDWENNGFIVFHKSFLSDSFPEKYWIDIISAMVIADKIQKRYA